MEKFWECEHGILYQGDVIDCILHLGQEVDMCITSPPYWAVRDYHNEQQLGMESKVSNYIENLLGVFIDLQSVIKDTGSFYLNIGDIYYGGNKGMGGYSDKQFSNKGSYHEGEKNYGKRFNTGEFHPKELLNIPNRLAIKLVDDGKWLLRNTIIWHKPNQFPTSAKDRYTMDFEYLFWFVKDLKNYYFEQQFEPFTKDANWNPIREKGGDADYDKGTGQPTHRARNMCQNDEGKNKRCVWSISTEPVYGAQHFAKFPRKLIRVPILASCPPGGTVLDPFIGSGTTAIEAISQGKRFIGFDINPEYLQGARERIEKELIHGGQLV